MADYHLPDVPGPRVVVLLEGRSDVAAVRTLAVARGLDETDGRVELVDMGGATNVRRHLDVLLRHPDPPRVLGMCDAGEVAFFRTALTAHGIAVPDSKAMGTVGFHVCHRDLEDELIRALGADQVLMVLDELELRDRFAALQQQPAWRGRSLHAQLRRFAGVASGRKALLGAALAAALPPQRVPRPLATLLDQIETALEHSAQDGQDALHAEGSADNAPTKKIPRDASDRGRRVRSRGERSPVRGAPNHRRRSEMQYLISVIDDGTGMATPTEAADIDAFNDRLRAQGHWVFAGGLGSPDPATVIDNRGDETVFTDGPFVESKEYLAGFWIIEAADLDVALKLAAEGSKACNRKVEVRPFL